jgi:CO/xanthine dehydrogenase Mo-binding subunit
MYMKVTAAHDVGKAINPILVEGTESGRHRAGHGLRFTEGLIYMKQREK